MNIKRRVNVVLSIAVVLLLLATIAILYPPALTIVVLVMPIVLGVGMITLLVLERRDHNHKKGKS